MKVKEIDRTANIDWSPAAHHPIYLVAGTAAQQLDATFSTTAALEIYALNLTEPGLDMGLKGSYVSDFRFHKVIWGSNGMTSGDLPSGIIVGGADAGNLFVYDPAKLLEGEDALLYHKTKHSGPVHALDFNKFQSNLLASGASDSEIFIWDLNNPNTPMTPGAKSQPAEEVTSVSWNCQVQHILASTFPARCVVWDLRKNEPIIKVSDTTARLRCKMVAWHPEVATQLCLASEDDHSPLIQLWDLRFATSPLKTLERHQRGVLSIAWCPQDPDLLLSCGKDNRILCWNPNSNVSGGEVICELSNSNQWSFDVSWCPRNPAVIASASFDGHVSVYSLMGGQQQAQCSSKIAESFPGSDVSGQPPLSQSSQRHVSISLQKPPKWLRKPVGASFGFGGRLLSFTLEASQGPVGTQGAPSRCLYISQVVTEPDLLNRASKLESALSTGNLFEFCQNKIEHCVDQHHKMTWSFLQATFDQSPRNKMISLLGYNPQDVSAKVLEASKEEENSNNVDNNTDEVANKMSLLNANDNGDEISEDSADAFDVIAAKEKVTEETPFLIQTNENEADGLLNQALLTGNIEAAVDLCIKDKRWADALVLSQSGGPTLQDKTRRRYFKAVATNSSKLISSIITSDWQKIVKNCDISNWKETLAAILTYAKPEEFTSLCENLGCRLELENNGTLIQNSILCYICAGNLERLSQVWIKIQESSDKTTSLQSLVEQIMILRHTIQQTNPAVQSGTLSALLGQYAGLLAAQGCLASSLTYLFDSGDTSLAILRDRIQQALGQHSSHVPYKIVDVKSSHQQQQPHLQQAGSLQPQHKINYQAHQMRHNFAPQQQHMHQQINQYGSVQTMQDGGYVTHTSNVHQFEPSVAPQMPPLQQPTGPSVLPAPTGPPPLPLSDAASQVQTSKGHLSQRYPRHVQDASVYSDQGYSQSYFQPTSFPSSQPMMTQQYSHPQSFFTTEHSGQGMTYTMANSVPSMYSSSTYSPAVPTVTGPVTSPPSSLMSSLPPGYGEVKPGWNDPPVLKASSAQPAVATFDAPAPIMNPIIGSSVPEPVAYSSDPSANLTNNYFTPSFPSQGQPSVPQPPVSSQQVSPPEPPKEKGPIPPEHQILQDIYEDLRQQCQQVATNPQTRRKLDDIAKKMENLYDKLRENELSSGVILGLHQIVQAVQQGDYQGALAIHSQLVSSGNFSETSSFMPGIKVLLQTAFQLGVYLQ